MQQTLKIMPDMEHLGSLSIKGVLPMVSNISTTVSFITMLISTYTGIDGLSLDFYDRSISLRSIFFTSSMMNPLMTRHAERHEIALVMRAAIAERLDVMHERRRHKASVRSAHLAQRFSCQMPVANLSPHAAVPLMLPIAASEALVMSLHRLLMLLAVAALPVREIRATCHAARAFRFPRHHFPSLWA